MKLKIDNFAKIKQAEIVLDGITVIAGENNTGKSTVGKILFGVFQAIPFVDKGVKEQRKEQIREYCKSYINYITQYSGYSYGFKSEVSSLTKQIVECMDELNKDSFENVKKKIKDIFLGYFYDYCEIVGLGGYPDGEVITEKQAESVARIITLSDKDITEKYITNFFSRIFHNQINSLVVSKQEANIVLKIKDKTIAMEFVQNSCCQYISDINLLNKAIYIDNPFVIDELSQSKNSDIIQSKLKELLCKSAINDNIIGEAFKSMLIEEKLKEVYNAMSTVVQGNIIEKQSQDYYLDRDGFEKPISFHNLSAGLKSFVIIKMLLEKGSLKERDVLILDEPEIHLHPQWQIVYAELVVLLQKYFDLTIVVTTHSPFFLDAINLFSIKHGVDKKVNYYLSSMENDQVNMENVTDNIEKIYEKMASPTQMLDTLRYELFNK